VSRARAASLPGSGPRTLKGQTVIESRIEAEARDLKVSAITRHELAEAIHEDEAMLGRPHTSGERGAFVAGFLGLERDDES